MIVLQWVTFLALESSASTIYDPLSRNVDIYVGTQGIGLLGSKYVLALVF
jgi:hypothetical protein